MAFHCINCNAASENKKKAAKHHRNVQISCRLQEKVREGDPERPRISILEALEEIFEREVTKDKLERFSGCLICRDCHHSLRLAINKKFEVEQNLAGLHDRIDLITSAERRQYYREHYATDKAGKCWGCMFDFSEVVNYTTKAVRFNMSSILFEQMTVLEGIQTLLEEEAETLHGLFPKNTYLCKSCYTLMRQVVKYQCLYETFYATFMSKLNDKSIIACLRKGEIPSAVFLDNRNEISVESGQLDNDSQLDNDENLESNKDSVKGNQVESSFPELEGTYNKLGNSRKRKSASMNQDTADDKQLKKGKKKTCMKTKPYNDNTKAKTNSDEKADDMGGQEVKNTEEYVGEEIPSVKIGNDQGQMNLRSDHACEANSQMNVESDDQLQGADSFLKDPFNDRNESGDCLDSSQTSALASLDHSYNERENPSDDWVLYFDPNDQGTSEMIHLLFEAAGVPYRECDIKELNSEGEIGRYPHFAPPILRKGNLQLSQVPVICHYLGEKLGLYPETEEDRLHAEQISHGCHDYISEVEKTYNDFNAAVQYASEKKDLESCMTVFVQERLPLWMGYFEKALKSNPNDTGFLFGTTKSYADLLLFHALKTTEARFPRAYQSANYIPQLKLFSRRIAEKALVS